MNRCKAATAVSEMIGESSGTAQALGPDSSGVLRKIEQRDFHTVGSGGTEGPLLAAAAIQESPDCLGAGDEG